MNGKQKISYCLWMNNEASEAVDFYQSVFPGLHITNIVRNPVNTPSGEEGSVLTISFNLEGQSFMLLNGGSEFSVNPSISFFFHCDTAAEVEELYSKLSHEGKTMMPLDKYPFSDKYAWVEDKYGVSWQLMLPQKEAPQKVMPSLMFVNDVYGRAEEAIKYYTSLFKSSKTGTIAYYPEGSEPDKAGAVMYADFMLERQWFACMDSGYQHQFNFSEGMSLVIHCHTQEEIDYYWDRLAAGGKEVQCGWLVDKFGVSWQVVPDILLKAISGDDKEKAARVMQVMMKMVKLNIEPLEAAASA